MKTCEITLNKLRNMDSWKQNSNKEEHLERINIYKEEHLKEKIWGRFSLNSAHPFFSMIVTSLPLQPWLSIQTALLKMAQRKNL